MVFRLLTLPTTLADAFSSNCITLERIIQITRALIRTTTSVSKLLTSQLTRVSVESSWTETSAGHWITTCSILTHTLLSTVPSIISLLAWTVTELSLPPRTTEALTTLRSTLCAIHARTLVLTVLTRPPFIAWLATILSLETRGTETGAIDGRALRIIPAVACRLTIPAISQYRTTAVTRLTTPSRFALARSRKGVTQIRVLLLALADLITVGTINTIRT